MYHRVKPMNYSKISEGDQVFGETSKHSMSYHIKGTEISQGYLLHEISFLDQGGLVLTAVVK